MKNNTLEKYLVLNNEAIVSIVNSKDIINSYLQNIKAGPVATIAIGRLLLSTLLMGSTLKGEESLAVRFDGDGVLKTLLAETDGNGIVRGYVFNPYVFDNISVQEAIGKGTVYVKKQLNMKEPFEGSCQIYNGNISDDLSYYFAKSEQLITVFATVVNLDSCNNVINASGFMIQLMPFPSKETISYVESILAKSNELDNMLTSNKIMDLLFDKKELLVSQKVKYRCNCSLTKAKKLVSSLSIDELKEELDKGGTDITCNFCNKTFHVDTEFIKDLIVSKEK